MPKKTKIKRDEYVTDAGLVLDAEQAAMVRKQVYEGSYSLRPPEIEVTDDDITVRVGSTVYTVYGDSPLLTTTVLRRSESSYTPAAIRLQVDVECTVRDAIERARDAADAAIKTINEEWEAKVCEFDDEDEGLREGPVVGGSLGSAVEDDVEAVPSIAELKRRKVRVESGPFPGLISMDEAERRTRVAIALIAEEQVAEMTGDTIRIPNGEYADLIAAKREGEYAAGLLDSFPGTYKIFLKSGVVTLRTTPEGHAALEAAIALLPVDAFWHRACGPASDVSDSVQADDGGPVEPELDIDALVAGRGVQASIDGRPVPVTVSFTLGGQPRGTVDDLRKAFASARNAGGIR